jgi:hypothetical protein
MFNFSEDGGSPRPANYWALASPSTDPDDPPGSFELGFSRAENGSVPLRALRLTPRKRQSLEKTFYQFQVSSSDPQFNGYLAVNMRGQWGRRRKFFAVGNPTDYLSHQNWILDNRPESNQKLEIDLPGRFHRNMGLTGLVRFDSNAPTRFFPKLSTDYN